MSYLDFPRIHFTGGFQAAPSTVNNAPENYKRALAADTAPWDMDSWWNAYGNGVFNLSNCAVSAAQVAFGTTDTAIVGQQVFAAYTSSAPKIVDLDPMQQNVSQLWGMTVQVGLGGSAGKLAGNFAPVAFNNIWVASNGAKYGSAAGAGVYQSTLTDVIIEAGSSTALQQLAKTLSTSKNCLSIRLHVRAYNATDTTYDLTTANLAQLRMGKLQGMPEDVWQNLSTVSKYHQGLESVGGTTPPDGMIVATQYLNFLLQRCLGEQAAATWGDTIRAATAQPGAKGVDTAFTYGKLVGTIGPSAPSEPRFFTAKRMMAPAASTANYAPFQVEGGVLSVDLTNALQTKDPSKGPLQDYGTLTVGYVGGATLPNGDVPYADFATFIANGGIVDIQLPTAEAKKAETTAMGIYSDANGASTLLIGEDPAGTWMRADQFVFRMNPGMTVSDPHLCGDSGVVQVYVRQFGKVPAEGKLSVKMRMLSPSESYTYTNSTIGTGGTPGLSDVVLATTASALTFGEKAPVKKGVARFDLTAKDPKNPRKFIDGQVYFLEYTVDVPGYTPAPDDKVSVLVFEHTVDEHPTWAGCVGEILGQYGRLYPIMARFGLDNHEQVKANRAQIEVALKRALNDPFHMPVTRDLSESRRQIILKWMQSGMP